MRYSRRMKFVDEARLKVQAGNGGRGSASFRREKFVPFGGPDGGEGGHGGSIYLRTASGINTLADFRIERTFRAANGEPGGANDCSGRSGADLYVPVPLGTVVRDADTHEELGDLTREGEELLVARGGKGGWGNQRFKSSTNRSPRQFGPGLPGEEHALELELTLIADVGPRGLRREAEGRRLSLHDAAPEPRRGAGGSAPQFRHGRHSGPRRGGRRGRRTRDPVPQAPAAHAADAAPRGYRAARPAGRPRARCARDRPRAEEVQQGALCPAALAGAQQARPPAARGGREAGTRHCARAALHRAALPDLRGDRRGDEGLVRSGYEAFGGARSRGTRARIISSRCWRRAAGRSLRGVGMTGTGIPSLSFALIESSLHRADAGGKTTLVPRSLVTVDDLLAHERIDDRDCQAVALLGHFLVAARDGRRHPAHRGTPAGPQR